jgi:hypothetical protein
VGNLKQIYKTPQLIEVDQETLRRIGFSHVLAKESICSKGIQILSEELIQCKSAHSWKPLVQDNFSLDSIHHYEEKKRPSIIFSYYGDSKEYIGSAVVAFKINHKFNYQGYPVLARAFIREKYRNNRLYYPILCHRINFCEQLLGDNLCAIHMGSNNPRIYNLIEKRRFLNFVHIGSEVLEGEKDSPIVRDFIRPYQTLMNQLDKELHDPSKQIPELNELWDIIQKCTQGNLGDCSRFQIEETISFINNKYQIDCYQNSPALAALVDLLINIPVLSTPTQISSLNQTDVDHRRLASPMKKAN